MGTEDLADVILGGARIKYLVSFLCSRVKFWIRNQNRVSSFEIPGSEP